MAAHGRTLMKRVQYFHYGAPEELQLDEVAPLDPGKGQIRVQVMAAAANPMDWKIRRGEICEGRTERRINGRQEQGVE